MREHSESQVTVKREAHSNQYIRSVKVSLTAQSITRWPFVASSTNSTTDLEVPGNTNYTFVSLHLIMLSVLKTEPQPPTN